MNTHVMDDGIQYYRVRERSVEPTQLFEGLESQEKEREIYDKVRAEFN